MKVIDDSRKSDSLIGSGRYAEGKETLTDRKGRASKDEGRQGIMGQKEDRVNE